MENLTEANDKSLEFFKKEHERYAKDKHPAAKHLKKILDDPSNKTNVLRNAIHAHCFECSHDPSDAGGSHPKHCKVKNCPFFSERPQSVAQKAEKKAEKEVSTDVKKQRQARAEKARAGRKLSVKEAVELLEAAKDVKYLKKFVAQMDADIASREASETPDDPKYFFKLAKLKQIHDGLAKKLPEGLELLDTSIDEVLAEGKKE